MFPQRNQQSTYYIKYVRTYGWTIVSVANALLKAKVGNTELDTLKWVMGGSVLSVFEMPFLVGKVLFCSC